jgi:pimeloyl-ACP methyl ester carboxylesterase
MRFLFRMSMFFIVGAVFAGTALAQNSVPHFDSTDCWFDTSTVTSAQVECGYVTVPEDHTQADNGKTIKLAVAVFKTQSDNHQDDPVIYLEGGPGGAPVKAYGGIFDFIFGPFAANRDFILFDQRGTGLSEPSLNCPQIEQWIIDQLPLNLPDAEQAQKDAEAVKACHDQLVKDGDNLAVYNTAQSAADVNDIVTALGYKQVNLYGISYGTRLGLEVMRQFPQIVRSSIIDSVVPPQIDNIADQMGDIDRVFHVLFDGCNADARCSKIYPNLDTVLKDTADQLDQKPVTFKVTLPSTGKTYDALLNGKAFVQQMWALFYQTGVIPEIPQLIYAAHNGDFERLSGLIAEDIDSNLTIYEGMYYSVNCHDETPFTSLDAVVKTYTQYPEFAKYVETQNDASDKEWFSDCALWGAGTADPSQNQAVTSDIPTLVTNGEYDPVTPPDNGHLAAQTLSKSFVFDFPETGHGSTLSGACPNSIAIAFVEDPTAKPDDSCIKDMQTVFAVPVQQVGVNLVPFSDATLGVGGVMPEGWSQREPGVFDFIPGGLPTMAYRVPQDGIEGYVKRIIMGRAYGYTALPDPVETRDANGISWKIYKIDGTAGHAYFAFASNNGKDYVIGVVAGNDSDRTYLHDKLFIPAIDAFKPTQ